MTWSPDDSAPVHRIISCGQVAANTALALDGMGRVSILFEHRIFESSQLSNLHLSSDRVVACAGLSKPDAKGIHMDRPHTRIVTIVFAATLGFFSIAVSAGPFAKGNPATGKALVEKSCISCHTSMYGGDGSGIYTRPTRIVKSPPQLLSRIRTCNTFANAGWFPEEEMDVAAYLNQTYYHFK